MKQRFAVGAFVAAALLVASASADDALKSGPQVGKSPAAFNPLHITGEQAGQKACLV